MLFNEAIWRKSRRGCVQGAKSIDAALISESLSQEISGCIEIYLSFVVNTLNLSNC